MHDCKAVFSFTIQYVIKRRLPWRHADFAFYLQAQAVQLSKNGQHLVYVCACGPGHSGAALILSSSRAIGMHTEGVIHMRERKGQAETREEAG